jgi:hypothetical protein
MAETAESSDGLSSRAVVFWFLAVLGAVLMYVGEGIIESDGTTIGGLTGQELSAIGLTVVLTVGTVMIIAIHFYGE